MDVTALRGIAKARWWILVAAAILAVYVTGRLADYQNDNLISHEAITSITFVEDPSNLERGDFEQYLSEQSLLAEDANSDLLGETPGPFLPWELAEIHLVSDQNQIIFIGRGYTQAEADEIAMAMRDKYLSVSTVGAGRQRMSQELDDLTVQIGELTNQINARQAVPAPTEDETVQATTRTALETRISSLQGRYGALGVELMNPVDRSAAAVQNEIDRVLEEIIRLQLQLRGLPETTDTTTPAVPDEQLVLDQLKLSQLQATWTQIYTQLRDLEALASVSDVVAQPPTVGLTSTRYNQALALGGALVVAMLALVAIERTRGIVWSTAELKGDAPVLTELPPRQLQPFSRPSSEPWYIAVPAGRRKASVQLIRSQFDALQNQVIAFQGTGVYDSDTLDLAADVAMSAAVSGRNVLLIDATFSRRATQVEYGDLDSDDTLMNLLSTLPDDPEEAMSEIKNTLLSMPHGRRELRALRSGVGTIDAGDALASQHFEMVLDVAREHYDLVVVTGAAFGEPTSHMLAQRVDDVVLVGSIGHTIDRQVEAAERDFKSRRAALLGIVMLRRRRGIIKRWVTPVWRARLWTLLDWLRSGGEGKATREPKEAKTSRQPKAAKQKAAKEPRAKKAARAEEMASAVAVLDRESDIDVLVDDSEMSQEETDGSPDSDSPGFMEWIRSGRQQKSVVKSGFQTDLERFGVTDPTNLRADRYDPDGVMSEGSAEGGTRDASAEGETGGDH